MRIGAIISLPTSVQKLTAPSAAAVRVSPAQGDGRDAAGMSVWGKSGSAITPRATGGDRSRPWGAPAPADRRAFRDARAGDEAAETAIAPRARFAGACRAGRRG